MASPYFRVLLIGLLSIPMVTASHGWRPVFKVAKGQSVSPASDVYSLWTGTYTLNENNAQAFSFDAGTPSLKSSVVDNWSQYSISQVRVSMYQGGQERAYLVFNAAGTDKNNWYTKSKLISSSYSDLPPSTYNYFSIVGHSSIKRRWFLHRSYAGCDHDYGWFCVIEGDACTWERRESRPYFVYSNANTYQNAKPMDNCNPNPCPSGSTCEDIHTGYKCHCPSNYYGTNCDEPYRPVFKVAKAQSVSPASSVYDLWTGTYTLNEDNTNAYSFSAGTPSLKSSVVDNWSSHTIRKVRISLYKDGQEKSYFVFNAAGTNKNNWYSSSKFLSSPYSDLPPSTSNYFSIAGHSSAQRRWFLHRSYAGCDNDFGWLCVIEGTSCDWEKRETRPYFGYSNALTYQNAKDYTIADSFVISLDMDNCNPSPCKNGAQCQDINTGYVCNCAGNWYGTTCETIDGGWSSYSSGSCSKTCGGGTLTKTRSCNNPAPAGGGNSCSGSSTATENCNTNPCPINGGFSSWSAWGTCSKTCGGGTQSRTRSCTNPAPQHGGASCSGATSSSQNCNTQSCPVNGGFSSWSAWGTCSKTCGGGTQSKTRSCTNPAPQHGGASCSGDTSLSQNCNTQSCPGYRPVFKVAKAQSVSPASSVYDLWTGTYTLNEDNSNAYSVNAGTPSLKSSVVDNWSSHTIREVKIALFKNGQEQAYFLFDATGTNKNNWFTSSKLISSSYTDLPPSTSNFFSISGDSGIKRRWFLHRSYGGCDNDFGWLCVIEGDACNWEKRETRPYFVISNAATYQNAKDYTIADSFVISLDMDNCNPNPCQNGANCQDIQTGYVCTCAGNWYGTRCQTIDGGYTSWSAWGSCSVSCGGGSYTRTRTCTNPAPQNGGQQCSGATSDTGSCNTHPCPIDGEWTSWTSWAVCSLTCGGGSQSKTRTCTNPPPQHGGAACPGSTVATQSCNTHNCPIDGEWSSWAGWASCSVTCGGGRQSRTRSCTNPPPQYNGADCVGSDTSSQDCNTHHCPIDGEWASWSSWATCSVTCGGGLQSRTRACTNPVPQYNGAYCSGSSFDMQACNTQNCPIDGNWASWTSWSTCSLTCGGGSQSRSRTCTDPSPQYSGADCPGSGASTQACNTQNCPIDGVWATWSSWGTCTVTCGGGTQDRSRTCTDPSPQYGGAACTGASSDTTDCNTQICIIDGAWGAWSSWGTCTVTCGGGMHSRYRQCDDPAPANGGLDCSGDTSDYDICNSQACPVVAAGVYQQICPTSWFTCAGGRMTCIQMDFVCDCDHDCEDGSDENVTYAGCNPELAAECGNSAPGLVPFSLLNIVLCAVITALLVQMAQRN